MEYIHRKINLKKNLINKNYKRLEKLYFLVCSIMLIIISSNVNFDISKKMHDHQ